MNKQIDQVSDKPAKSIEVEIKATITAVQQQTGWKDAEIRDLVVQHLKAALEAQRREELDARDTALGDAVFEEQRVGPEDKHITRLEEFVDAMHVKTLGELRQHYLDELSEKLLDYAEENDELNATDADLRESLVGNRTWYDQEACSRASELARTAAECLEDGHAVDALSALDEAAGLEKQHASPGEQHMQMFHKQLKDALQRVSDAEAAWEKEGLLSELLAAYRSGRDGNAVEKQVAASQHPELIHAFALEAVARSFASERLLPEEQGRFIERTRANIERDLAEDRSIPEIRLRKEQEHDQVLGQ